MRNLFRFIKIYHFILLFILIESFSLFLYISNHKFQQSKFLSFTQEYTGKIFNYYSNLNQYLSLKKENDFRIIYDEVFTGFYKSKKMFYFENFKKEIEGLQQELKNSSFIRSF